MKPVNRADSIQNKEVIVTTAIQLFQRRGIDISLTEIAKEANVSRMTFYRHFSDKNAIVLAVFQHNLKELDKYAQQLQDNDDAFYFLLKKVLIQRVEYHNFLPYIDAEGQVLTSSMLIEIFEKPIQRAKEKKLLRNDFSGERDLLLLISMMGGAVTYIQTLDKTAIERTLELITDGIKLTKVNTI